ncbi:MAG TPA: hypothetical protein DCP20_09775 [Coriobacteriia bacterium]|nr:hypothetical protein [Coriobacteriia bacterium]
MVKRLPSSTPTMKKSASSMPPTISGTWSGRRAGSPSATHPISATSTYMIETDITVTRTKSHSMNLLVRSGIRYVHSMVVLSRPVRRSGCRGMVS